MVETHTMVQIAEKGSPVTFELGPDPRESGRFVLTCYDNQSYPWAHTEVVTFGQDGLRAFAEAFVRMVELYAEEDNE